MIIYALIAVVVLGAMWIGTGVRVIKQFERGVVFRFGKVRTEIRGPGLALIAPIADRLQKVNMQIITMPVPAQDGITRDNVMVRVDAVVYMDQLGRANLSTGAGRAGARAAGATRAAAVA